MSVLVRRLVVAQLLLYVTVAGVQAQDCRCRARQQGPMSSIGVGKVQVYDPAALELALDGLIRELCGAGSFFDVTKIKSAIGSTQGANARQTYLNVQLQAQGPTLASTDVLTRGVTAEQNSSVEASRTTTVDTSADPSRTVEASNGASSDASVTANQGRTVTRTVAQAAPTIPVAGMPSDVSGVTPLATVSMGAQDLYGEQINMSYQVAVLRMTLERLVSRPMLQTSESIEPHGRAVIGFPISVNADRNNAVAEVQLVFTNNSGKAPVVIDLLPKETTYNCSVVTTDSKQWGLGAVVQWLGIGLAGGKKAADTYLVKDADTVALLSGQSPAWGDWCGGSRDDSIMFGWQFRPVLRRPAVTPGTRWVFAVLELPEQDTKEFVATVQARTCWRVYSPASRTVGREDPASVRWINLGEVKVPARQTTGDALKPTVTSTQVYDVGDDQFRVVATGTRFLPGTRVLLGSRLLSETDGLVRGENTIAFSASAAELALYEPRVLDRYGRCHDMRTLLGLRQVRQYKGDADITADCSCPGRCRVTVTLTPQPGDGVDLSESEHPWVALVGRRVITPRSMQVKPTGEGWEVSFTADRQLLEDSESICLRRLLADTEGTRCDIRRPLPGLVISQVLRTSVDTEPIQKVALLGRGFDGSTHVFIGDTKCDTLEPPKATMMVVTVKAEVLNKGKAIIAINENGETAKGTIPAAKESPRPKLNIADEIYAKETPALAVTGSDLDSIEKVTFNDKKLDFGKDAERKDAERRDAERRDVEAYRLCLAPEVTKEPGVQTLKLTLKDGTEMFVSLEVLAPRVAVGGATPAPGGGGQ